MRELSIGVRAELKGLPPELAEAVGAHLMVAGLVLEEDPALALRHAQAARRRAARLTVTREAVAEAAYAAGEWRTALSELRALRRMTGEAGWLAVMADCERALGRPQEALSLVRDARREGRGVVDPVELVLVEAGCRADLGQQDEAVRLLRASFTGVESDSGTARIRTGYALADRLVEQGRTEEAGRLFGRVADWDVEDDTDATQRAADLINASGDAGHGPGATS